MKSLKRPIIISLAIVTMTTPAMANGADFALGMLGGVVGMALAQQGGYAPHRYGYPYYGHGYRVRQKAAHVSAVGPSVPVRSTTLARDQQKTLSVFYNCRGDRVPTFAKAEHGSVSARPSSRFLCGEPDHPVVEFVYLSAPGAVGSDRVAYFEHGRQVRVDNLFVNDSVPPVPRAPRQIQTITGRAMSVWRFWDCNPSAWDVSVVASATNGSTTVRTGTGAACGRTDYPIKEVFYQASRSFVGTDTVIMRSSISAPIALPVKVEAAATPLPPVGSNMPPPTPPKSATVDADHPTTAGGGEKTILSDCACGYLAVDGSIVRVYQDNQKLSIRYVDLAPGLAEKGVKPGTVLFEGMKLPDGSIGGKAYVFKDGCAPAPYGVLGRGDGARLTLWGRKPVWQGCSSSLPTDDKVEAVLVFNETIAPSAGAPPATDIVFPRYEKPSVGPNTNVKQGAVFGLRADTGALPDADVATGH